MYKQVIVIRKDLGMGKGKLAAQAAHASLAAYKKASPVIRELWEEDGSKKVVVGVKNKEELFLIFERVKKNLPAALIKDAGLTQIKSGEVTALGIGPAKEEEIDNITGNLKLL